MNLLLLDPSELTTESTARVDGRRAGHIHKFLKPTPGDDIRVGMINGLVGTARVSSCDRKYCLLDSIRLDTPPPPKQEITLLLALPRPLMLKRILQHATSLGVKHIVLLHTERVEKSFWLSSDMQAETLREQLLLGLEQAMDTVLPELELARSLPEFVEKRLDIHSPRHRYLLLPDMQAAALQAPPANEHCSLLIGPERGFSNQEIDLLEQHAGFVRRQMGQRILRVETAVTAAIARTLGD